MPFCEKGLSPTDGFTSSTYVFIVYSRGKAVEETDLEDKFSQIMV